VELADRSPDTIVPPSFGASLREARIRRNISLEEIAAHTKINRSFLQDLERNDFSKWPHNQFYCESYLRAYSTAIGLDPHEVIDAFRGELAARASSTPNPVPPSRNAHWLNPVTIPIILAVTFVVAYSLAHWYGPASHSEQTPPTVAPEATMTTPPAIVTSGSAPKDKAPAVPAVQNEIAVPPPEAPPVETARVRGELAIDSTPPGARVLVNGIARGSTPLVLQNLPPGSYMVRMIPPGRAGVTRTVTISPERPRASVTADLEPQPEPPAVVAAPPTDTPALPSVGPD
jgi:cytoskeleton protein RodZ